MSLLSIGLAAARRRSGSFRSPALAVVLLMLGFGLVSPPAGALEQVPAQPGHSRGTGDTDWPMFRSNSRHTGHNPHETVLTRDTVGGLELAWAAKTDSAITLSSPAVVDGVV